MSRSLIAHVAFIATALWMFQPQPTGQPTAAERRAERDRKRASAAAAREDSQAAGSERAPAPPPADEAGSHNERPARSEPGSGPPVRVQATIFRLELPASRMALLDAAALAKSAATADALQSALGELGKTSTLYHVDQAVGARRGTSLSTQLPVVVSAKTTEKGTVIPQVHQQDIGAVIECEGSRFASDDPGQIAARLGVEVSDLSQMVELAERIKSPILRKVRQNHEGLVEAGRPIVLVAAVGDPGDSTGNSVAYVTRVVLSAW